jgi:hypothetical protein
MTTLDQSARLPGALLPLLASAALLALSGCEGGGVIASAGGGGGGPSVNATPYTLFASNFTPYIGASGAPFLHSVQNGDVYTGFGGNFGYGCYSFNQADMDAHQFYALQGIGDATYSPGPPESCTVTGTILAPGSNAAANGGTAPTSIAPLDISQSTAMLVQMGNIFTASDVPGATGGNATVFTVVLDNGTVPGQVNAGTAECFRDVTLGAIGRSAAAPLGVLNYNLDLVEGAGKWVCTTGSLATLKSTGVTSVTVKFTGDKNPNLVVGDYDLIAVGYIGFTK